MLKAGLPALWLYDELDRLYASEFLTSDGSVLIFPDRAYFITDSRFIEAAQEQVKGAEVILCTNENREADILRRLLSENGVTELGAQAGDVCAQKGFRHSRRP